MRGKKAYRIRTFLSVLGVLVFAALLLWLIVGINSARTLTEEVRLDNVRQSVVNGAVLCYSVEGVYPEDIGYLKDNYGVRYDEGKYLVHYRYIAADIMPAVNVFVSEQNSGG